MKVVIFWIHSANTLRKPVRYHARHIVWQMAKRQTKVGQPAPAATAVYVSPSCTNSAFSCHCGKQPYCNKAGLLQLQQPLSRLLQFLNKQLIDNCSNAC